MAILDRARFDEVAAFLAVAERLSFAAAAEALGRDGSAVTRRVAALEARLGVRLLHRTTRRVTLTDAGRRYEELTRRILDDLDTADAEAAGLGGGVRGTLRISLPAAFGRIWVAPLLADLLARHRELEIEASFEDRYVDLLAEGFDAAVRTGALADSRLVARRLAENRRLLVASPAYLERRGVPATPAELEHHECLGFNRLEGRGEAWRLAQAGRVVDVAIKPRLRGDEAVPLLAAACAGAGIAIGAEWAVGPELAAGALRTVLPDWEVAPGTAISVVTPTGRLVPAKTRAFVDLLVAAFTPVPPWRKPLGSGPTG